DFQTIGGKSGQLAIASRIAGKWIVGSPPSHSIVRAPCSLPHATGLQKIRASAVDRAADRTRRPLGYRRRSADRSPTNKRDGLEPTRLLHCTPRGGGTRELRRALCKARAYRRID